MLVKEKKPNEYTEGTGRQEQTETDTRHKAQAGSAQAGQPGAQAGTWWGWAASRREDRRPRGSSQGDQARRDRAREEPHGKGSMAPMETRPDWQTQPQGWGGEWRPGG